MPQTLILLGHSMPQPQIQPWKLNASALDVEMHASAFSLEIQCHRKFVAAALDFSVEVEGVGLRYCLQNQCSSLRYRLEIECISLRLCLETQSPSHSFHLEMYCLSLGRRLIIQGLSLGVWSGIRSPGLRICLAPRNTHLGLHSTLHLRM